MFHSIHWIDGACSGAAMGGIPQARGLADARLSERFQLAERSVGEEGFKI